MRDLYEHIIKTNRDRMNHADPTEVAMATVGIFDSLQTKPPEVRAMALAAALSMGVEHMGISPQDVMTATGNMRAGAERYGRVEFKAIENYLTKHWKETAA